MESTRWLLSFEKKENSEIIVTFFGSLSVNGKWIFTILVAALGAVCKYLY